MHSTPEAVSPRTNVTRYTGLIEHYRDLLPLAADARAISLGEGRTPLIKLENLPKQIGFEGELYVKFEGLNPTGSFKDRGMTVAVTQAVHEGAKAKIGRASCRERVCQYV